MMPPNPYTPGTQLYQVLELLKTGEKSGADFLRAYIPEYRSRLNELEKEVLEPNGFMLKRRRQSGSKFIYFSIIRYSPLFKGITFEEVA